MAKRTLFRWNGRGGGVVGKEQNSWGGMSWNSEGRGGAALT